MSTTIVITRSDEEFKDYEEVFYRHFNPDDVDYMVIGARYDIVDMVASKLAVCWYKIEYDLDTNKWYAVTYHS